MIGNILGVVVNVLFLTYVKKLEKEGCVRSDSKFRDYIKYFSGAIGLFVLSFSPFTLSIKVMVPSLMLLLSLVIFRSRCQFILFKYSHKLIFLKTMRCSQDWRRSFILLLNILPLFSIIAILMVLLAIRLATMSKGEKAKYH